MEWLFGYKLESENLITEYEQRMNYKFPKSFTECVKKHNGTHPSLKIFLSKGKRKRKRVFNSMFSFNQNDIDTIWNYNQWNGKSSDWNEDGKMENYVAFADDPFGNLICFDKTNDKIIFIDHETLQIESVADSFEEFINNLRKS